MSAVEMREAPPAVRRWENDAILTVEHLTMRFGGLVAVDDLSFSVGRGDITAIIGPNGAGKTTVFNCLTGFYKPTEGMITMRRAEGETYLLERMPDFRISARARVARTFQNIRLFGGMTVLENLMVAQHNALMKASYFTFGGVLGLKHFRNSEKEAIERAKYWLDHIRLMERADDPAADLPYGAQRRLEIARAMCTHPEILCLDEPAAGLNPREFERAQRPPALHPRRARDLRPAHRARHERRHGDLRPRGGARLRQEDLGRPGRGGAHRPGRDRRLSRRRGRGGRGGRGRGRGDRRGGREAMNGPVHPLLSVRGVETYYGNIMALRGVDIDVHPGEIVTLIGANGAGKSTLMMTICGSPQARNGTIVFDGTEITRLPTHEIMRLAIAQSPEGRRIFPRMTVLENLQMGAGVTDLEHFDEDLRKVYDLFPVLKSRRNQRGGTLSGGEQQMLAIARALMSRPRLLLLDEPSLGLAPLVVKQIFATIGELNRTEGLTVFLVEQNAYHALKLAHRGYVMVNGNITMTGTGPELLAREEVRAAYLEGGRH